jgi:hypothetical protein
VNIWILNLNVAPTHYLTAPHGEQWPKAAAVAWASDDSRRSKTTIQTHVCHAPNTRQRELRPTFDQECDRCTLSNQRFHSNSDEAHLKHQTKNKGESSDSCPHWTAARVGDHWWTAYCGAVRAAGSLTQKQNSNEIAIPGTIEKT